MKVYCANCDKNVNYLVSYGRDLLLKKDQNHLKDKKFLECPDCSNFVGTCKIKKNDLVALGPIVPKKTRINQKHIREKINLILEIKKDIPEAKEKLYLWLSKRIFRDFSIECLISKEQTERVEKLLNLIK